MYVPKNPPPPSTPILLDVMLDGRFVCQLRYHSDRRFYHLCCQKVVSSSLYDSDSLRYFVESRRPSLAGKRYSIRFSNQIVFQ